MLISCGSPGILAGYRRLVFTDIGNNYNSDDFELYTTGAINLGSVTAVKATDFELFTTGQNLSFVSQIYNRNSCNFESFNTGVSSQFAPLDIEGSGSLSTPSSGISDFQFAFGLNTFELLNTGSTSTGLPPLTSPASAPQPSGAQFQIFL